MKVPALLKNKYVCYALMALAALNVIGYVTVKAWECLALFSLAGYSAHCYCKNVSVAILAGLFVANFVFGCGRVKEGFEDAMKGPVEKMADIVEAADEVAKDETTTGEGEGRAEDIRDAAAAFVANKDTCCDGDAWKSDLTGDVSDATSQVAKCQALGDASTVCADPQTQATTTGSDNK